MNAAAEVLTGRNNFIAKAPDGPVQRRLHAVMDTLHSPLLPTFRWNTHAPGGFDAPPQEGIKDMTGLASWESGDTIRVAAQIAKINNGEHVLIAQVPVEESDETIRGHTVWFAIGNGLKSRRLYRTLYSAYVGVDLRLGSKYSGIPDHSHGWDARIETIHGTEAPQQPHMVFERRTTSRDLLPDTGLVQGTVVSGRLLQDDTQDLIEGKPPGTSKNTKGTVIFQVGEDERDKVAVWIDFPSATMRNVPELSYRSRLFPGDVVQVRTSRYGPHSDIELRAEQTTLIEEGEMRRTTRKDHRRKIRKLFRKIENERDPASLRQLLGEYYTLVTYPYGDVVATEQRPQDASRLRRNIKARMTWEELPFAYQHNLPPFMKKDFFKRNLKDNVNLFSYTIQELRDYIRDMHTEPPSQVRMHLYTLAAHDFSTRDFGVIVRSALRPEAISNHSEVELRWLSGYFQSLDASAVTSHTLDMIQNVLRHSMDDVVGRWSVLSDYALTLKGLNIGQNKSLQRRRTRLLSEVNASLLKAMRDPEDKGMHNAFARMQQSLTDTKIGKTRKKQKERKYGLTKKKVVHVDLVTLTGSSY